VNASIGFTYNPISQFNITVDGYWVRIKDRVVLSGQFDATDPDIDPDLAAQMQALKVSYAQFFANAVNTTNKGVDIVLDYNRKIGDSRFKALFAGNIQDMNIDQINVPSALSGSQHLRQTFLSDREQAFILASAPKNKLSLNLEYGHKNWALGTRFTRFGKITLLGYGEDGSGIDPKVPSDLDPAIYVPDRYEYSAKAITDVYWNIDLKKGLTLYLGVDNLFNVHPDLGVAPGAKYWAFNNETGGPFDAVQTGSNGRKFYTRLAFRF
jgi:iron complex outermembrane receptor protein